MRHYALIGNPVKHSFSKEYFDSQHFSGADYRLYGTATLDGLRPWVVREHIDGFNVTAPHKQAVMPLLDSVDPEAAAIGAVNCVVVGPDGRLDGHNTDGPAFRDSLEAMGQHFAQAFILGTGGASRAVAWALRQLGIPCRHVSLHPERHPGAIAYADLTPLLQSPQATLLVNATPLGTWPDTARTPLTLPSLALPALTVYDLVYNPSPTLLMRQAAACGATVCDGLDMLQRQARLSWRLWSLT